MTVPHAVENSPYDLAQAGVVKARASCTTVYPSRQSWQSRRDFPPLSELMYNIPDLEAASENSLTMNAKPSRRTWRRITFRQTQPCFSDAAKMENQPQWLGFHSLHQ